MNIAEMFENAPDLNVETVMTDSRKKCENGIFFCIPGMVHDGHDFVDQAISNGAICIVHSKQLENYVPGVTYLMVEDTIKALNEFTAAFYGDVTKKMTVFGVTGTNGKSSIAWMTRYLVHQFVPCGYIGTLGILEDTEEISENPLTTPDTVLLHKTCKDMYDRGCKAVAMEVSSIGLEEHRVDSVAFDYVSYTNLTHDHLDYHGNYENYFNAKKKLFLKSSIDNRIGIVNIDDPYGARLMNEATIPVVSYAVNQPATYRATNVRLFADHTEFNLVYDGKRYPVWTNLIAMLNVYNLLNVIGFMHEAGYEFDQFIPLLRTMPRVLGRMETINEGQKFNVLVDYAHTPDAFEKVFEFAKAVTKKGNRIITIFGCAGARDTKKRPIMGQIADENSDVVILTTDDPRWEDPAKIAEDIRKGMSKAVCMFMKDREQAVRQAIELANPGDTVMLLGKGDEEYYYFQDGRTPCVSDRDAAIKAIHEIYDEGDLK